ncbi:programmed cell death protein 6-like [Dysidea avara]|uniref:programmed cell death protein 6-like n=1 Tax=Dysidea avara TaxID=196820 RepID=UPI003318D5B8
MSWQSPPYNPGSAPPPGGGYYGHPPHQQYGQPPPGYHPSGPPPPQHGGYHPSGPPPPQHGGYHQGYAQSPTGPPPGSGYPPPHGGYPPPHGGAPPPPAGPPHGVDPTLWSWFKSVDQDNSGTISALELRQALVNNNWSHFNEETCRLLVGMFDTDRSGTIDIHEFVSLWKYIQDWKGCFDRFDNDRSGNIDASELQQALLAFGYRVSINFCNLCTRVFDRNNKNSMKFDDFIQCCVMIKGLTESFQRLDTHRAGVVNINYEQFLEMAIDTSVQ